MYVFVSIFAFRSESFDGVVVISQGLVWVVDLVLDGVLEVILF